MNIAANWTLRTWDRGAGVAADMPLHFAGAAAAAELRCLPGASGVHIVVRQANTVRLRAEIWAEPEEIVPLELALDEDENLHLSSRGHTIVHLPLESRYDPPAPIRPATTAALDVAIIVDGTVRSWPEKETASVRLLEQKDAWAAYVEKLVRFSETISEGVETRVALLAFGDQEPPSVSAPDLKPRYRLYPAEENRVLQPLAAARLRDELLLVPPTPGADFVDATADALAACTRLHWRATRRLVLLTGDSPGASLLHPPPQGADLGVRTLDVDTQALQLHRLGVEIMTIYHAPPRNSGVFDIGFQRELLLHARDQFERLASLRWFHFDEASFDPDLAATRFRETPNAIGRGATLGELVTAAATVMPESESVPL